VGGRAYELAFRAPYPIDDSGEVALEDYARAVARAAAAVAQRDPASRVRGVRLLGLDAPPAPGVLQDVEDFARDLAARTGGSGLGWA
jgi:hypothetical protein